MVYAFALDGTLKLFDSLSQEINNVINANENNNFFIIFLVKK
jgi:hypothetical protein